MGFLTTALSKALPVRTNYRRGWVGDAMYVQDDDRWIGNGRNAARSSGQVSKIVFAAPGTLAPKAKVYLNFKQADCTEVILELHNCTTAAIPLAKLLADKINGVATPGSYSINTTGLVGYTVVTTPDTFTVDITGPVGAAFSIEATDFGTTANGVANPAVPTITTPTPSTHAGKLGYGLAVVRNIPVSSAAYQGGGRSIADEFDKIISTPTNHPTEEFLGFSLRRLVGELHINHDSCEPMDCSEGYGCGECAHWMRTELHKNKILVRLEAFPTGTTTPGTLIGMPIFYRHTVGAGQATRGTASILGADDPNRTLAKSRIGHEWYVAEVANAARREYYIGVR